MDPQPPVHRQALGLQQFYSSCAVYKGDSEAEKAENAQLQSFCFSYYMIPEEWVSEVSYGVKSDY